MDSFSPAARTAVDLLTSAGDLARRWFESGRASVEIKGDGTPVTRADRDVEDALRAGLEAAFPEDGIYGEEFPEKPGTSGTRWVIDPIDGTKSFIHGVPLYSTLLGCERDGRSVFGGIYCPSLDLLVVAEEGAGCWRGGQQVSVSQRAELQGAHVMATWLEDWRGSDIDRLHAEGAILRTWGDAFGYALVASGQVDALVDYNAQVYDLAPIPVILREAGGRFSSLAGQEGHHHGNGIGSNGLLHEQLLELLGKGPR